MECTYRWYRWPFMNDRPSRKWWFSMVFHTLNTQRVAKWLVFRRLGGEFLYPGILEIIRWLATRVRHWIYSAQNWFNENDTTIFFYGEVYGFWFFLKSSSLRNSGHFEGFPMRLDSSVYWLGCSSWVGPWIEKSWISPQKELCIKGRMSPFWHIQPHYVVICCIQHIHICVYIYIYNHI